MSILVSPVLSLFGWAADF